MGRMNRLLGRQHVFWARGRGTLYLVADEHEGGFPSWKLSISGGAWGSAKHTGPSLKAEAKLNIDYILYPFL